ncbi:hypothetical protein CPC08DRAFT_756357 [Agrocybe pediades]|nr:hypothetical protein CPC08DRAFT_756357 [Agrocybe pediades]
MSAKWLPKSCVTRIVTVTFGGSGIGVDMGERAYEDIVESSLRFCTEQNKRETIAEIKLESLATNFFSDKAPDRSQSTRRLSRGFQLRKEAQVDVASNRRVRRVLIVNRHILPPKILSDHGRGWSSVLRLSDVAEAQRASKVRSNWWQSNVEVAWRVIHPFLVLSPT